MSRTRNLLALVCIRSSQQACLSCVPLLVPLSSTKMLRGIYLPLRTSDSQYDKLKTTDILQLSALAHLVCVN